MGLVILLPTYHDNFERPKAGLQRAPASFTKIVMNDLALLEAFEDCSLSPAALRHRDHIFVAWSYLQRASFGAAGDRFCANLRRFAEAHGKTKLFHETITWAYVTLIHERMQHGPSTFAAFAEANPDLFDHAGGALARIYDKETLASEHARRVFVFPRGRG